MTRALLDINVLIALLDSDHADHRRAHEWMDGAVSDGWASCAITQNGFVRIVSQPAYPSPVTPYQAVQRLERATNTRYHEFWSCSVSILDDEIIDRTKLLGPRQVTDAYLVALAVANGGRFATFDRSVPVSAVRWANEVHLVVV